MLGKGKKGKKENTIIQSTRLIQRFTSGCSGAFSYSSDSFSPLSSKQRHRPALPFKRFEFVTPRKSNARLLQGEIRRAFACNVCFCAMIEFETGFPDGPPRLPLVDKTDEQTRHCFESKPTCEWPSCWLHALKGKQHLKIKNKIQCLALDPIKEKYELRLVEDIWVRRCVTESKSRTHKTVHRIFEGLKIKVHVATYSNPLLALQTLLHIFK